MSEFELQRLYTPACRWLSRKSLEWKKDPFQLIGVSRIWAPGIFWLFLLENPHAHKIPPFRGEGGGVWGFLEGGVGSTNFIF